MSSWIHAYISEKEETMQTSLYYLTSTGSPIATPLHYTLGMKVSSEIFRAIGFGLFGSSDN